MNDMARRRGESDVGHAQTVSERLQVHRVASLNTVDLIASITGLLRWCVVPLTNLGSSPVTLQDPNYPAIGRRNFNTNHSSVTLKLNYHF